MTAKIHTRPAQTHAEHSQRTQATEWAQHHDRMKAQTGGAGKPPYSPPKTSQAAAYYGGNHHGSQ